MVDMKVQQLMSRKPEYLEASATIGEAVARMGDQNRGFTPIADREKLVGVVTDRDIALRGLAKGKTADDPISSVMSRQPRYCYEDDGIKDVLQNMQDQGVQRLLVMNNSRNKDFIGVISLADIAEACNEPEWAGRIVNCCRHYS